MSLLGRQGAQRQGVDLVSHFGAEGAVDKLMPLQHALAGEFTGHDLGLESLNEYLETKNVHVNIGTERFDWYES